MDAAAQKSWQHQFSQRLVAGARHASQSLIKQRKWLPDELTKAWACKFDLRTVGAKEPIAEVEGEEKNIPKVAGELVGQKRAAAKAAKKIHSTKENTKACRHQRVENACGRKPDAGDRSNLGNPMKRPASGLAASSMEPLPLSMQADVECLHEGVLPPGFELDVDTRQSVAAPERHGRTTAPLGHQPDTRKQQTICRTNTVHTKMQCAYV